jgi:adenosylcobyric acid synthase
MMKGFMVQGTSSDSGKSFIVTGFCRLLSDMGFEVCPFKSQNMSNNSYVTADGLEIGRAQGVQAEAARVEADKFMNPILLKPRKDTSSEIVLFGKVFEAPCGRNYYRTFTLNEGLDALRLALKEINSRFEVIVAEGAGSPAEINLNSSEIVNMRVAREADIPVILVTDVDRGGAMASIVGTLELLGDDRKRVKGIIFNKFRGDIELFQDAVKWTEKYTGVKVLGVVPWVQDLIIEGEDVLSLNWQRASHNGAKIKVGSVKFKRISNHTDMEAFRFEPDVSISEIDEHTDLNGYDAVVLPGTKSTVSEMKYLHESGLAARIKDFSRLGGFVFGICGGYQIMGEKIYDPYHRDNEILDEIEGLGLLPISTGFTDVKSVRRRSGMSIHPSLTRGIEVSGYEIHFGRSELRTSDAFFPMFDMNGEPEGVADISLRSAGTYLHNVFHNDSFRSEWLNKIRRAKGLPERKPVDSSHAKEEAYDRLASLLHESLDIDYVLRELLCVTGGRKSD